MEQLSAAQVERPSTTYIGVIEPLYGPVTNLPLHKMRRPFLDVVECEQSYVCTCVSIAISGLTFAEIRPFGGSATEVFFTMFSTSVCPSNDL
jgi:hypothetical protein